MNYFVTGGTGFIGHFLIPKILDRGGNVFLLVRKNSLHKVDELREYCGAGSDQIIAVEGDLREKNLGVGKAWIAGHEGFIDHFMHLAAIYDITADAESQRLTNVEGTAQAIALSKALKAGCFHLVSSIAAAGLYKGTFTEDMFEEATGLDNPYFATKHESEGLVRKEKRMPWRIYRPGMVVGHSETGQMDKIDGPYYFFETVRNISKVVPDGFPLLMTKAGRINVVPVDFVANAIDHLAHLPDQNHQCFYITDPNGIRVGDLLKCLLKISGGGNLRSLDLPLFDAASEKAGNVVAKITPIKKLSEKLMDRMGVPAEVLAYINYPTHYDNAQTTALLAEGGVECPPFQDYAQVIWDYWLNFLRDEPEPVSREMSTLFDKVVGKPSVAALRRAIEGKVVVVTGATSGIGKECALRLAQAGADVVLVARTLEKLDETLLEIEQLGGEATAYSCDVSEPEQCDSLVEAVLENHGHVDVLINNAGRSIRRSVRYSYDRFHDFERTMQLNYFGALRLITGFLPSMEERKTGQIINVSSIGVLTSPPRFSAYVASKAALDAFTQCAAPEYVEQNIHFTTIHMPLVRTPMIAPTSLYRAFPTLSPEQARDLIVKAILGKPKRVSTGLGIAGAVAQATTPHFTESLLAQAYHLFPDSAAARGLSEEEAAAERANIPTTKMQIARKLFTTVMRGGHW
ncbi:MAG: SDR family oxidoreductase [Gammaproteobacteria bacterium]|nr:SDR family oxidoreductase [Gammaproteobacteria bacterium]NND39623.1 SDR family oxidoreductase [Pseudomonadales bacterium]NNL10245.1 SDR family oxidoreductase [Pseudomonadales bacterium]NNM11437.1 SDR family oxidoreductase [Pseudomonadales bacterium]